MYIGNTAFVTLRWNHPTSKNIRYSNKIPGWKIKVDAIPWIKMDKGWFSSRPWLFTEIVFIWLLSEWSTSQGILKSALFVGFCSFSGGFEYEKYQIPNYTSQHEALSIFVAVEVHLAQGVFFPITKLSSSQTQTIHVSASWSSAAEDGWRLCARVRDPIVFQDWQKRLGIWHRFQRAPFLLMVFCWFFVFFLYIFGSEWIPMA